LGQGISWEGSVRRFGELEAEIMNRLWARSAPTTVREIVDELQRERPIAYTTVMTVMDTLFKKGWLHRHLDGRAYRYEPVATREQYSAELMRDALDTSGDRTAALAHFLEQLSPEEARALRDAVQQAPQPQPEPQAQPRPGPRPRRRKGPR
jgi:predicted transcriptional regulator